MATSKDLGFTIARDAAADLTGKLHYLATVDSNGKIALASAGGACLGNIIEENIAGKPATVQYGAQGKVICGDDVRAGQMLASDGSSKAVPAVAGDYIIGQALDSGAENEVIEYVITHASLSASP